MTAQTVPTNGNPEIRGTTVNLGASTHGANTHGADPHEANLQGTGGQRLSELSLSTPAKNSGLTIPLPPRPTAAPFARVSTMIIALVLICGALIGVWEVLSGNDPDLHSPPVTEALHWLYGHDWTVWFPGIAIVGIILGLILLVIAVLPRKRRHFRVKSQASVWVLPSDLARIITAQASTVRGVLRARTVASHRRIRIRAYAGGIDHDKLVNNIKVAVDPTLSLLESAPPLVIRISTPEGPQ